MHDAMAMMDALRSQLERLLDWQDAHVGFDAATAGIPSEQLGMQPSDLPYSPWQLVEHMRLTQRDILEFCRDPAYEEPSWPDEYWPADPQPPSLEAWEASIEAFRSDRAALQELARDGSLDLFSAIPHGAGQTYLRELLLAAGHTAYHVGQLVVVRRLLGSWQAG